MPQNESERLENCSREQPCYRASDRPVAFADSYEHEVSAVHWPLRRLCRIQMLDLIYQRMDLLLSEVRDTSTAVTAISAEMHQNLVLHP